MSVELERKVVGAFLGHIGDLSLTNLVSNSSCEGGHWEPPTKFRMPAGAALSSARLAKNKRPFPVS